jgi:hypothetical protein
MKKFLQNIVKLKEISTIKDENQPYFHKSIKCRDNKVIYNNICTAYSENNTDNINNINYVVTQYESKEILHNLIDGNDYELTVEVEEEYSNNIYNFYKINDISVVIDYKQNVSNCNNSIVDCSDESRHTCITVNTSHCSDNCQ